MWRRIGVIVLWVLATVGTASITLAAVGQVGESTTEQAAVPVNADELRASPAVQRLASTTTTTTVPITTPESSTTTVAPDGTTTTTAGESAGSTTTTGQTTTVPAQGETVVRSLVGGTVTVFHQGTSVTLVSAVPVSGGVWTVEVKNSGPESVVVEFESSSHESKYQASVSGGQLVIEIDENPEGDDD